MIDAASQVTDRPFTSVLLSAVVLAIGAVTIVSSLRLELFAGLDRHVLDEYEKTLLVGEFDKFKLMHSASYRQRELTVPESARPGANWKPWERMLTLRLVRAVAPSFLWVVLEVTISVAGAAIPILGIFHL